MPLKTIRLGANTTGGMLRSKAVMLWHKVMLLMLMMTMVILLLLLLAE